MEITKLYNEKVTLIFDDSRGKHIYYLGSVDKKNIVGSVTGAVGVIDKPALLWWAAHEASKYWVEKMTHGIFSADQATKKTFRVSNGPLPVAPIFDEISIEEHYQGGRFAHRVRSQHAANIGKLAHEWIEKFIKGEKPPVPINKNVKAAVKAFLDWAKKHKVKFLLSEQKVYSKKYKFAGTLDFEAIVDGILVIGDLKTSKVIWPEMLFQTAGYQLARQEEFPENKYGGRLIVRIGKELKEDGTTDFEAKLFTEYKEDAIAFISALRITNRLNQIKDKEKNG